MGCHLTKKCGEIDRRAQFLAEVLHLATNHVQAVRFDRFVAFSVYVRQSEASRLHESLYDKCALTCPQEIGSHAFSNANKIGVARLHCPGLPEEEVEHYLFDGTSAVHEASRWCDFFLLDVSRVHRVGDTVGEPDSVDISIDFFKILRSIMERAHHVAPGVGENLQREWQGSVRRFGEE